MNFNISLEKKYFFILLGAILILAGAIHGYAQSPAIFGHQFEELEGAQARVTGDCSAGSSIRVINDDGTVTCEPDNVGSAGNLNCNIRTGPTNKVSTATCTSSYTLTGGGCQTTSFNNKDHHFYPSGNSYICEDDVQPLKAYAICCKIT